MDRLLEKYRKRLVFIGLFKSAITSLAIAFVVMGVVAGITWLARASVLLTLALTFGISGVIFIAAVFILYFTCFRPTNKMVAEQLDALGYDERYITMLEYKNEDSLMAELQREDAKKTLAGVPAKLLKFTVTLPIMLLFTFGVVFATGTTTGSLLASSNQLNEENIEENPPAQQQLFTVRYEVYEKGTGTITGQLVQKVEKGHYTTKVTAIPESGYKFEAWVDQDKNYLSNQNNPRVEINVHEDMTIYALFIKKSDSDSDNDSEEGKGEGDKTDPEPGGGSGGEEPDESGGEGGSGEGQPGGGEGESRENNNVIDGTKDYKEDFDREKLEKELLDKDLPDDLKDILGDYYGTLKP